MKRSLYFLSGNLATNIVATHGLPGEDLPQLLTRIMKKNNHVMRSTARELGLNVQTFHNWCRALKIRTLTRKQAGKLGKRPLYSNKQLKFLEDYGHPSWSLTDTLSMMLAEVCDGDISTLSLITDIDASLLRDWCKRSSLLHFTSMQWFYNHSHQEVVERVERDFAHLGANWKAIMQAAIDLHDSDVYRAAKFLGIQNITAVRWCSYWNIPFVSKPRRKPQPSQKFQQIQEHYAQLFHSAP